MADVADATTGDIRIDLHCHTNGSFDSIVDPIAVVRRAAERGLTHLLITDHDTIDVALRARDAAPDGLTVIVGCEVNTPDGDLIFAFLEHPLPRGLRAIDAIAAGREQGALVGIPHPFDRHRRSLASDPRASTIEQVIGLVDWVEVHNARVVDEDANHAAADLAARHAIPGVAASDAHSLIEIGTAWTSMAGSAATASDLKAALATATPVRAGGVGEGVRSAGRSGGLLRMLRSWRQG